MNLLELLEKLKEHETIGADHGVNCICMDKLIWEVIENFPRNYRTATHVADNEFTAYLDSTEYKIRKRIAYIIRAVADKF